MLNKTITIYCKEDDNFKIEKVVEKYINRGVRMLDSKDDVIRITFDCSIFKVSKLRHDIELLNNIGIKTQIKEA